MDRSTSRRTHKIPPPAKELSPLDLLEEVEAEMNRLRAKIRRLTTVVEETREQVTVLEKRIETQPAKRATAKKKAAKTVTTRKPAAVKAMAAAAQGGGTEPGIDKPKPGFKRKALGKGLMLFFERSRRR